MVILVPELYFDKTAFTKLLTALKGAETESLNGRGTSPRRTEAMTSAIARTLQRCNGSHSFSMVAFASLKPLQAQRQRRRAAPRRTAGHRSCLQAWRAST